jgi:hypothetical protein
MSDTSGLNRPAALLAPIRVARNGVSGPRDLRFALHCANRDTTNFSMLRYNGFQGHLATGKNSGTHWVKYMLSLAIAAEYGVPPPRYFNSAASNDIIGHPKHKRKYSHLPRIASSHSIPNVALNWKWVHRAMSLPAYVVVVRDMRDALISNYVKWRETYGVPFDVYVAGDPSAQRYICDVWWYIHFMNRWGEVATRLQDKVLTLRYEDLRVSPDAGIRSIARHFGIALSENSIRLAVEGSSKKAMLAHEDPDARETVISVRAKEDPVFGPRERAIFDRIVAANLCYDFGYRYFALPEQALEESSKESGVLRRARM